VIDKALENDPADRYQTMRDMVVDLRRLVRGSGESVAPQTEAQLTAAGPVAGGSRAPSSQLRAQAPRRNPWIWPAVAVFAILASAAAWIFRPVGPAADSVRLQIPLPPDTGFSVSAGFAISPDGKKLVFSALGSDNVARFWLRNLDSTAAAPLPNSEHDSRLSLVLWSPDSRKIAFIADQRDLKVLDLVGAAAHTIARLDRAAVGGSWGRGVILLGNGPGILSIDEVSGRITPVTAISESRQEDAHVSPVPLPDGKHFLYIRASQQREKTAVFAGSLDAKPDQQDLNPVFT